MTQSEHSTVKIKRIGIFSGKGGVGKTSISASLALLLKDLGFSLLLSDTDVDAPNLALSFKDRKKIETFIFQTTEKAYHIPEKCSHCKLCVIQSFCTFNALKWDSDGGVPVIDSIKCEGCKACELLCPMHAFGVKGIESGKEIHYIADSDSNLPILTGETILGAQSSGKLVTELKKVADRIASSEHKQIILQDGPPGIGCPVIAATGALDLVIVIIEPTKASLHDADRYIQIPKRFGIPVLAILNKSDMNPKGSTEIKRYLSVHSIELLGEIPLEEQWPYSIVAGIPIVQYSLDCPASLELKKIVEKIVRILNFT